MPDTITRAPHTNRCELCFPEQGPMFCPNCGRDDWSASPLLWTHVAGAIIGIIGIVAAALFYAGVM